MKHAERDLDICEVAHRTGLTAATLRFYEAKGLLTSSGRRGLRRTYGTSVLERLALIGLGRSAGFSLDEIASMLTPGPKSGITRQRLAAKAAELETLIQKLTFTRDGLMHAIECKAPDFMSCPHFLRILAAASARAPEPLPIQPPTPSTRRPRPGRRS